MANSNIPLVRSNSVNDINTSIIAIKKELKVNGETDINVNVDVNYPENAYPVDAVTDGDMHAVTSNAVFDRFGKMQKVTGNANDLTSVGFYTGYALTNTPIADWVNILVVSSDDNPLYCTQIASYGTTVYIRNSTNGVWENWRRLATGENIVVTGNLTSDASGNIYLTSLLQSNNCEIIYVRTTSNSAHSASITACKSDSGDWWGLVYNWGSNDKLVNLALNVEICYRLI